MSSAESQAFACQVTSEELDFLRGAGTNPAPSLPAALLCLVVPEEVNVSYCHTHVHVVAHTLKIPFDVGYLLLNNKNPAPSYPRICSNHSKESQYKQVPEHTNSMHPLGRSLTLGKVRQLCPGTGELFPYHNYHILILPIFALLAPFAFQMSS